LKANIILAYKGKHFTQGACLFTLKNFRFQRTVGIEGIRHHAAKITVRRRLWEASLYLRSYAAGEILCARCFGVLYGTGLGAKDFLIELILKNVRYEKKNVFLQTIIMTILCSNY
jgi:hypothetical protein